MGRDRQETAARKPTHCVYCNNLLADKLKQEAIARAKAKRIINKGGHAFEHTAKLEQLRFKGL